MGEKAGEEGREKAIKQICASEVQYSLLCQAACRFLTKEKVRAVLRGLGHLHCFLLIPTLTHIFFPEQI